VEQPRAKKRALTNNINKAIQLSNTQQCEKAKKKIEKKQENNTTRQK
jgi:hypothetical protein